MISKVILILTAVFCAYLLHENRTSVQNRKKLQHVIYVNGTRGKSTVTRLIDAAVRAGGYRVFSKTTGSVPQYIDCNGEIHDIKRRGGANIKEQLWILKMAAQQKAEILVCECMAVDPFLQKVSQERMVRSDIGVITNVRLDHTEEMGKTLPAICESLSGTIPSGGVIITGDEEFFPQISRHAEAKGTKCILADATELEDQHLFSENIAIALEVAKVLGIKPDIALSGIAQYKPDPFSLSVHTLRGGGMFVNAMAVNDIHSTKIVYDKIIAQYRLDNRKLILLINNRRDRSYRIEQMLELVQMLTPKEVWLIGDAQDAMKRRIEKRNPFIGVRKIRGVPQLDFQALQEDSLVFAIGNVANYGEAILEKVKREVVNE